MQIYESVEWWKNEWQIFSIVNITGMKTTLLRLGGSVKGWSPSDEVINGKKLGSTPTQIEQYQLNEWSTSASLILFLGFAIKGWFSWTQVRSVWRKKPEMRRAVANKNFMENLQEGHVAPKKHLEIDLLLTNA